MDEGLGGTPVQPEDATIRLVVAIATYCRPDLARGAVVAVVDHLCALRLKQPGTTAEVLVVDNDPRGSAEAAVRAVAGGSIRVRYCCEQVPGISAARNRALDEAAGADLLAFIDDDERPRDGWLRHLLETRVRYRADLVYGRVPGEFVSTPDPWVVAGQFYERPHHPTGTVLPAAAAGNLLLDVAVVRRLGVRFESSLGLTGGEDTLFTRRLVALGARIVWCEESEAAERIPDDRATRAWVLRRSMSHGNTGGVLDSFPIGGRHSLLARTRVIARGVVRMSGGSARWLAGLVLRSTTHQARGARTGAKGVGMVIGGLGFVFHDYGRGGRRWQRVDRAMRASLAAVPTHRP